MVALPVALKVLLAVVARIGGNLAFSLLTPPSPPARPAIRWPIPIRWIPGVDKLADQVWAVAYLLGYADGAGAGWALGLVLGVLVGILFTLAAMFILAKIRSVQERSFR